MPFFDKEKKTKAVEELAKIMACAERAGISHAVFIGFGVLLGIIREKDFIGNDSDMDICINADKITPEQELAYYKELKAAGLFLARRKHAFRDVEPGFRRSAVIPGADNRPTRFSWFSLRMRAGYPKCCNWFWFKWNGYYWHSKGHKWVTQRKFDKERYGWRPGDAAILKGIPADFIESLETIRFYGIKVNIPTKYGSCLDFWYPGWWMPKGGSSSKKIIAIVDTWKTSKKWRITVI